MQNICIINKSSLGILLVSFLREFRENFLFSSIFYSFSLELLNRNTRNKLYAFLTKYKLPYIIGIIIMYYFLFIALNVCFYKLKVFIGIYGKWHIGFLF